ncbi:MAG: hypothetical protein J1E35_06585 [Lachnospiraceae bacterium]|nr:hypothetical protein [Lachnospiraceae bacterium]
MNKRIVVVFLFILVFVLSACNNKQEGIISNVEHNENGKDNDIHEIEYVINDDKSGEEGDETREKLTEKEVMKAFNAEMPDEFLYEAVLIEADESYTYALIVKKGNAKVITSNTVSFYKNDTELLFIAVDNETGILSYIFDATENMKNDYYLRQAGLILVDEKAYLLLIHQMNYNEWERFGLDTFVLIDSEMKHVYGEKEGNNLYNYWFTHKAEFCADGTIEISKRTAEFELYQKYIHKFSEFSDYPLNPSNNKLTFAIDNSWEKEYKGGLYEFVSGQTWSDISEISLDNRAEVDILLKMKQCELIQEEIGIQTSECAVLFKEEMGTLCLFVVKAKNDFHQAGFQNLIFLLYDKGKDDFISVRAQLGDFSDAYLFQGDNGIYLAYYAETVYTGIPSSAGGVLSLQRDSFVKIWPSESGGESFFDRRVAELTEDGRYLLYKVEWNKTESGEMINFYLNPNPEEIISVFDIIKAEEEKSNVE